MLKLRTFFVLSTFLSFFSSCEVDPFTIGNEWVNPNFRMIVIDTVSVKLSTVMVDSISTRNQNVILAGRYNDFNPILSSHSLTGITTAKSFFELTLPSSVDVPDEAVFDSITLEMRFNQSYFGDTTVQQHLKVYQLAEEIELGDNRVSYYNTTDFAVNPVPLAEAKFDNLPYTNSGSSTTVGTGVFPPDPVRIHLPSSLGKDLLRMFNENNDTIKDGTKFTEYFKGIVLAPGDDSKSITGFRTDTSFKVRLYYHIQEREKIDKHIDFSINTMQQFNQILSDRSNTSLSVLKGDVEEVVSSETDNFAFLQSGAPIYVKIEFPYLNGLKEIALHGAIEQAILYVKPVKFSYGYLNPTTPLPAILNLYESNLNGGEGALIVDPTTNQTQTGNLRVDNKYFMDTYYSYDITRFLSSQLGVFEGAKKHLQLVMPAAAMQGSVQRLIVGDQDLIIDFNGQQIQYNQIELKIYYTIYND